MRPLLLCVIGAILACALSGCVPPGSQQTHTDPGAQPTATSSSQTTTESAAATNATTTSPPNTSATVPAKSKPTGLHTPAVGSVERKAILNALRAPVEKRLKQAVVFKMQRLVVDKGWAFALGQPIRPNGKRVDYSKTPYAQALKDGMFDDSFSALLHFSGGSWKVATYNIGATDVEWVDWDTKYGAPSAIFPAH